MSYPAQAISYQTGYCPPVQHNPPEVFINNQVQSYSIVPQQYLPVTNTALVMAGQQSAMPYVLHQEPHPLATNYSGFSHTVGNRHAFHPHYIPNEMHPRQMTYHVATVQQTQCIPHFPKPRYHVPFQAEQRGVIFNQEPFYNEPETIYEQDSGEEDEREGSPSPLQDEQSSELHENSLVSSMSIDDSTDDPTLESKQGPAELPPSGEVDTSHSPSETTLVPSPLSSDGLQTVCNSPSCPVSSDNNEEGFAIVADDDDEIPTKDTDPVTGLSLETALQVQPEQPYSGVKIEPPMHSHPNEFISSKQDLKSSKDSNKHPSEDQLHNTVHKKCSSPCLDSHKVSSSFDEPVKEHPQANHPCKTQQPIRSLIDAPMYNTGQSKVLTQLSQPDAIKPREQSRCSSTDKPTKRPLTTHFRLLFKPIPPSAEKATHTS